jgi:4a-hydroxytetrahydrobiopterin dehydratase
MLAQKSCTPCQGGVPKLGTDEAERLRAEVPEWRLREAPDRIERTFRFADFAGAFGLVTKVAGLAEEEGHHPDITFGWGYATITLYTHKIKGLHENDFIMAAKIDRLAKG